MAIKRDKKDIKFSNLIRMAANWTCQRCGTYYPEGRRGGLDCSHFFSRTKRSVRWHPWNAAAHCRGCHQYLGDNPIIFTRWIQEYLGADKYGKLKVLQNRTVHWKNYEMECINNHLAKELKIMEGRRFDGDMEHYFFPAWE